jgi:hypothetical protein
MKRHVFRDLDPAPAWMALQVKRTLEALKEAYGGLVAGLRTNHPR